MQSFIYKELNAPPGTSAYFIYTDCGLGSCRYLQKMAKFYQRPLIITMATMGNIPVRQDLLFKKCT